MEPLQIHGILFLLLVASLIGCGIWLWLREDQQRRTALKAVANRLNMRLDLGPTRAYMHRIAGTSLDIGRGTWRDVLIAAGEPDLVVGEFHYVVGYGKRRRSSTQTVFTLCIGSYPEFSVSAEKFRHKLAEYFGFQDIDFAEHSEFSSSKLLRGKDEQAVRRTFNREVRDWFVKNKEWTVETRGGTLALWPIHILAPAEIPSAITVARQLHALLDSGQDSQRW